MSSHIVTACLKAKKWFLGVGGAIKKAIFLKLILLGHTYPMTTEFSWTNCKLYFNCIEFNKTLTFFMYFGFLTLNFGIKCQFINPSLQTSTFVHLNSFNMVKEHPKYKVGS